MTRCHFESCLAGGSLSSSSVVRSARLALILALFAFAFYLHFDDVTGQVVGGDEVHSLRVAAEKSLARILTFHQKDDHSTLLTVYAKSLMQTVGLTEFRFRIPIMLCDLVLLAAPLLFVRRIGWTTALIAMALTATSPLVVYYSIVARPYTPAALFVLLSVHSWDRWLETRSNRALSRFVITSSLAIILHLYCLFPVALLMGLTLVRVLRAQLPRREFWKAGLWISLIVIAFMGPGLPLLLEHRLNKVGAGAPVFRTLQVSYMVLCGHLPWLALVFPFLLAAGLRGLQRRDSSFGLLIVALLIFQLVVLFATRPLGTVSVWARYYYLVWPLALILAAAGVEWIGAILCGWFRRVGSPGNSGKGPVLVALTLGVGIAVAVDRLSPMLLFRLGPTSFRTGKQMTQRSPRRIECPESEVFRRVRESRDQYPTVVIYPALPETEWKILLAEGLHGMHVKFASTRVVRWQSRGIHLINELGILDKTSLLRSGAGYLIVTRCDNDQDLREQLTGTYGPVVCSDQKRDLYDLAHGLP